MDARPVEGVRTRHRRDLDREGIPGRPWYRHQIYAPKFTYAPELLPAVAEAIETGEASKVRAQIDRLVTVLDRVAKTLAP